MSELIDGIKSDAALVKSNIPTCTDTVVRVGDLLEDIGNALDGISKGVENLENGTATAGGSEYAEKLGTPEDSYTKTQLDARLDSHEQDDTRHKTAAEQSKLDHLAGNPDATYATKDELAVAGEFNRIRIDLDLVESDSIMEESVALNASINEQFATVRDIGKPFVFEIVRKTGSDNRKTAFIECCCVSGIKRTASASSNYTYIIDFTKHELVTLVSKRRIIIQCEDGETREASIAQTSNSPGQEVILLTENSNGLINLADNMESTGLGISANPDPWTNLHQALLEKRYPAVYLKSKDSEMFCPAEYYFKPLAADSTVFEGNIRISYMKGNELWIENRKFSAFVGIFSMYEVEPGGLVIQKIPLGLPKITVSNTEPVDFKDGDIFIKTA